MSGEAPEVVALREEIASYRRAAADHLAALAVIRGVEKKLTSLRVDEAVALLDGRPRAARRIACDVDDLREESLLPAFDREIKTKLALHGATDRLALACRDVEAWSWRQERAS